MSLRRFVLLVLELAEKSLVDSSDNSWFRRLYIE
jgi:hypothetical protein